MGEWSVLLMKLGLSLLGVFFLLAFQGILYLFLVRPLTDPDAEEIGVPQSLPLLLVYALAVFGGAMADTAWMPDGRAFTFWAPCFGLLPVIQTGGFFEATLSYYVPILLVLGGIFLLDCIFAVYAHNLKHKHPGRFDGMPRGGFLAFWRTWCSLLIGIRRIQYGVFILASVLLSFYGIWTGFGP
jgi:hypothetical protein